MARCVEVREKCETLANQLGVKLLNRPPEIGELYIAARNGEAVLLEAKSIDAEGGWIVSTTPFAYPYDRHECFAIDPT